MGKIAVTGSTGFIGSRLVDRLLSVGHTVYAIGRDFKQIECDIVYHLACPSTTARITQDPLSIIDTIVDGTRSAMQICPTALFVNASSIGAEQPIDDSAQGAYNAAKRLMEIYLRHSGIKYKNYRIPAVYGEGMHDDNFIKRCVDGTAYYPHQPSNPYFIAHVSEVVNALVDLRGIHVEATTLGEVYNTFTSGSRKLTGNE